MKKHILHFILGGVVGLIFVQPTEAQTFKVVKVKGNKAVIQLPKGITLDKGKSYSVESEGSSGGGSGGGSRERTLGISGSLFTGSISTGTVSVSTSVIGFSGRYGWNTGSMEYGPLALLTYTTSGSTSSSRNIAAGGFFDYNLVDNVPNADMVYGLGASATIGSTSTKSGSTTLSGTEIEIIAGGQLKWFTFGHSTCLRLDGGLGYTRTSIQSTTTTETGLRILAGLQTYF